MQIEIKNLTYKYFLNSKNEFKALDNVSLTIYDNEFIAFIGETGSGKSTLVQHLNALLLPSSGEVKVDDFIINNDKKNKDIKKRINDLRRNVGLVFQFPEYQLFEETVEKDVAFGPKNFGDDEATSISKAHEALLSVGLDESYFKRSPLELSGGEKRRVAIAGILAINPKVLVLDEPTAGLDPKGQEVILSLLVKLKNEGKTIILVTHDMNIVYKYCDRVFALKHGKLLFDGKPSDMFKQDLEDLSIEIPPFYKLAHKLHSKGFKIDFKKLLSQDDLIAQIESGVKK